MNFSEEHSEQDQDIMNIVETLANKVVERRLEVPAVLMLEMHKPLAFLTGQAAAASIPLLGPLLGVERMNAFSRFISDRENIEKLILRIEELAAEKYPKPANTAEEKGQ